jgi:hypothetical protein
VSCRVTWQPAWQRLSSAGIVFVCISVWRVSQELIVLPKHSFNSCMLYELFQHSCCSLQ